MNRDRDTGRIGGNPGPPRPAPPPETRPTMPIRRPGAMSQAPSMPRGWHVAETQPIPAVPPEPGMGQAVEQATEQTQVIRPVSPGKPSLLKASGSMAVATLTSRITGFLWKLMLAVVLTFGVENDSFNVANTLPNMIFELLIGGVLTSIVVPVLVRAQKSDADGGERFVQQLMTIASVVLGLGTLLALVCTPILTWILVTESDASNMSLVNAFAYLLLPQIFFYGLSALIGAILQAKQIFSPPAWAPVVNNLVVIATIGVFWLLPGRISLSPVSMTDGHVLVLGIGVTLGVVCQAFIQLPALRRTGFRFRWRWGWDSRLSEFGGLALWMLGYVAISQVGLTALTRVATGSDAGALSTYTYVWMLLQLPYGVIGFSIMTAILPRMSAAAADGDHPKVIADLSLGNRLSTVTLLPVSAIMTALGVPLAMALFALKSGLSGQATILGLALALSAFGVLPYALTMMQMRTFNALNDARTPTLIMVVMTLAKVLMAFVVPAFLAPEHVVFGLTFVNSFCFVIGWLVGEAWLRHRLGPLGSRRFLVTLAKTLTASLLGGFLAWVTALGVDALVPGSAGAGTGWLQLSVGSVIGFAAIFGLMSVLRVAELQPAIGRLTGLLRRR
ncbi:murein biosynthesis integral membrane protein MurJ [Saccharopolyspora phatthalungensis]|uniref:Putative peptidoglycan lipid II flippase n=1 Tax=Saccharopolyspora phatthalungensis TaxID=664693 RepID=A0A840PVL3_9PSEU|nr:murein biosynthesis integral membrane protein MurJ [Saccharopolyspora phatthalungensis]MBB5154312.1 putative peptidoglycan lipid II flippase [Saccharopolyspora phatthalungensis]